MSQNWFTKMCRNAGLMVHHITAPVNEKANKQEVNRTVEEKKVSEKLVLRRTTIDEVEIKKTEDSGQ